jgi:class 3 adenylate cyclase
VTETAPRSSSLALVASFLFTDVVGFSKRSVAEQFDAKSALAAMLRNNLAALRSGDYMIKDTGDGALIAFVANPEHALYMALAIADDGGREGARVPLESLRTGLHLGAVKQTFDVEARPNFIGDGINAAKRIMDFAEPGQITASRAFFDAVGCLDASYAELFRHLGAPDDKHGRAHELYALHPSATVLAKLRGELGDIADAATPGATATESVSAPPPGHSTAVQGVATSTSSANSMRAPDERPAPARRSLWLIVAISVIAVAVVAAAAALLTAPRVADSVRTDARPIPLPPAIVASPADVSAPPSTSPAVPAKAEVSVTSTPPVSQPADTPRTATTATKPVPRPAAPADATAGPAIATTTKAAPSKASSAPAEAANDRGGPRCSRIIGKAELGEPLSPEEKKELANACR